MPLFDLPLRELEKYLPERREPADFRDFWGATLSEARSVDRDVQTIPYAVRLPHVVALDLSFTGFGGQRVHCWWIRPEGPAPAGGWPVVVEFLGYGDGRGTPLDWLAWPAAGFAILVMDTRGQGARARRAGSTGDSAGTSGAVGPHVEGFLTQGLGSPDDYFYRRVFTDAVLAVDAARSLPEVDTARVAVQGTSQGGAIALATLALADGIAAGLVNVPFLCHVERAIEVTESAPYAELLLFARTRKADIARAFETLTYFDGMTMAAHGTAPALFSVALMDDVCPPSTVYAAYNHYTGDKSMEIFPWNKHEGGGEHHDEQQIQWLQERFGVGT
ncbi:acetylxylan esterase [Knoellia subterranea]|uniref:Acetyl xylan esterase n=1 Tax=Knoellia subterranea KCTC 19937 TaxID=1385521 RepID=A0A0A0JPS5_9MICO|nr:acetylxylan esterase [Knoellia subterranea]KGN38017.1 acetyl xylan esterase [Knoellia subterranea KCTC 19937]